MLGWGSIAYGSLLSALFAAGGVFLFGSERRSKVAIWAGVATIVGVVAWHGMVRGAHADSLNREADFPPFPASWSDLGAAVFAFTAVVLALGLGPRRSAKAVNLIVLCAFSGLASLVVATYLY